MSRCMGPLQRDLTPYEHQILAIMCLGKSNSAIAAVTGSTTKAIENTVSRSARVFGISSTCDTNVRVLLALAYRRNFGDDAIISVAKTPRSAILATTR